MNTLSATDTIIICGNGINAHSLYRILERQNWPGQIVFVRHVSEPKGFVGAMGYAEGTDKKEGRRDKGESKPLSYALPLKDSSDFPAWVESTFPDGSVVFFTDERWHPAFLQWNNAHPESKIRSFLGSESHLNEILDRYEFCRFIDVNKLANVPMTIRGDEDPFDAFGDTFIVRPRLSWKGVAQRERVKLVEGREEFERILREFADRGIARKELSFQEKLSIRDQDNVSICGWVGPEEQHLYCTRKLRQWPPKTGGGDLVERVDAPEELLEQARALLMALEYEGPFELEFVFDENDGEYKVTELNPRFWLQHGLIDCISGSALVRRYLGTEPLSITSKSAALRYWVNPLYAFQRCFKLDAFNLRCWVSSKGWAPFSLREAIRYAFSLLQSKFGS